MTLRIEDINDHMSMVQDILGAFGPYETPATIRADLDDYGYLAVAGFVGEDGEMTVEEIERWLEQEET